MNGVNGSASTRPETELTCWDCERPVAHDGRCDQCEVRYDDALVNDYLCDAS